MLMPLFNRTKTARAEMLQNKKELSPLKDFGLWLLWMGLSPEAEPPVSSIGIYADFT